jgi:8-oxo-dGTP pyrophosphatase MutT (NUDIX family)
MTTPGSSDRWTFCTLGHVHWGAHGGAGLLLRHVPRSGEPVYLLAERSRWVDEGGTWGMPGGAIHDGESPETAAHREANEEIWPVPPYRVTGIEVQDCGGGWKFHIIHADVDEPFTAYTARETDSTGWFTLSEMRMRTLRLHPGLRQWVTEHTPPQ